MSCTGTTPQSPSPPLSRKPNRVPNSKVARLQQLSAALSIAYLRHPYRVLHRPSLPLRCDNARQRMPSGDITWTPRTLQSVFPRTSKNVKHPSSVIHCPGWDQTVAGRARMTMRTLLRREKGVGLVATLAADARYVCLYLLCGRVPRPTKSAWSKR